jgi:hypothetical protein
MHNFNWIELGTLIVAILGFTWTIKTLNSNNKIKRAEFLKDLYGELSREAILTFIIKLEGVIKDKTGPELLPNPMEKKDYNDTEKVENEKSLVSLLTLFDEIYYFYETKLIREKELVYVAYELKLLFEAQCVKDYIQQYHALIDSFPSNFKEIKEIYPFTGLHLLYKDYANIVASIG